MRSTGHTWVSRVGGERGGEAEKSRGREVKIQFAEKRERGAKMRGE